ncbi:MAG: hypothetical protein IK016_02795 [Lachnospiraceae bacterium]|nr:hypothetical protein [Lachnospiraceae bacterium]
MKKETLYEMVGYADDDLLQRSEQHLVRHIGKAARFGGRRLFPIAAAAAVFLACTVTAVAVMLYTQRVEQITEPINETVEVVNENGIVEARFDWEHNGPGVVFTYEGINEDSVRYVTEFRAGYLPAKPTVSILKRTIEQAVHDPEDGWYVILERDEQLTGDIPYKITQWFPMAGSRVLLAGECEIVKEEEWGNLQVAEVHVRHEIDQYDNGIGYDGGSKGWPEENHILLFDRENGHVIQIAGTLPLEELEHIARELEIRLTDVIYDPYADDVPFGYMIMTGGDCGYINLGRG